MKRDHFLEGEIRKRWHPHFLSNAEQGAPVGASAGQSSPDESDLQALMKKEIENLKKRTEDHLKVPQIQIKPRYRKTRIFFMFLGMIFLAFIFFAVGFMVCFSLFPPHSVPVTISQTSSMPSGQSTYLVRQGIIADASGSQPKTGLLNQIENQSALAAQRRSQEVVARTTDSINAKLRNVLGYQVESVVEPVTRGIAGLLINSIGDPRETGMTYNTRGNGGSRASYVAPQPSPRQQADISRQAPILAEGPPRAPEPTATPGNPASIAPKVEGSTQPLGQQGNDDLAHPASAMHPMGRTSVATSASAGIAAPSKIEGAIGENKVSDLPSLYSVEVSTFEQSQDAYVLMEEMRKRGYDAYIVRTVHGSTLIYQVRFGEFRTYHHARDAATGYRSLWNQPARVAITSPQDDKMRFR